MGFGFSPGGFELVRASGSPTKVHRIQSVVLSAKESKSVEPNDKGISDMVHELIEEKTIA